MRWASLASIIVLATGCYHYTFEQRQPAPGEALIRHERRVPTWLNGLVGTGSVDTAQYCAQPVRTELQVRATDVLLSLVTLLIYTPHTLYVTCAR
jgi:Bor protein